MSMHCSGAPRQSRVRLGRTRCRREGPCGALTGGGHMMDDAHELCWAARGQQDTRRAAASAPARSGPITCPSACEVAAPSGSRTRGAPAHHAALRQAASGQLQGERLLTCSSCKPHAAVPGTHWGGRQLLARRHEQRRPHARGTR